MAVSGVLTMHLRSRQLPYQAGGNLLCSAPCCLTSNFAILSSSFREITARRIGTLRKRGCSIVRKRFVVRAPVVASQEASTPILLVQEVEFTWKGQGSEVLLTGDFLNWDMKLALEKRSNGLFSLKQTLALGRYLYKFIVDGEWKHSPDSPMVPDGTGGFNNEVIVADQTSIKDLQNATKAQFLPPTSIVKSVPMTKPAKEGGSGVAVRDPVASSERSSRAIPRKMVAASLKEIMSDNVMPLLRTALWKEAGITDVVVTFEDNQLKTSFAKEGIPYCFWVFFPDGILEGSRGSSLTSHGSPPSTIEPFLVDEKKITPELLVFWIKKRLFAQKILSIN